MDLACELLLVGALDLGEALLEGAVAGKLAKFGEPVQIIEHAIAREQLPATTDPSELMKYIAAPIYYQLLMSDEPLTEATADRVRIRVYDTGCGIPPDRIGAIFDDFVTTKRRGLGLGLAISKKIVEQLGGQISVASEVGKGTTFILEFPRAKARPIALVAG